MSRAIRALRASIAAASGPCRQRGHRRRAIDARPRAALPPARADRPGPLPALGRADPRGCRGRRRRRRARRRDDDGVDPRSLRGQAHAGESHRRRRPPREAPRERRGREQGPEGGEGRGIEASASARTGAGAAAGLTPPLARRISRLTIARTALGSKVPAPPRRTADGPLRDEDQGGRRALPRGRRGGRGRGDGSPARMDPGRSLRRRRARGRHGRWRHGRQEAAEAGRSGRGRGLRAREPDGPGGHSAAPPVAEGRRSDRDGNGRQGRGGS